MRIDPLRSQPGMVAYACPACAYVTSVVVPAGAEPDEFATLTLPACRCDLPVKVLHLAKLQAQKSWGGLDEPLRIATAGDGTPKGRLTTLRAELLYSSVPNAGDRKETLVCLPNAVRNHP